MTTDLARHTTVVELVATYRAACADIVRAFGLLHGAEKRLAAAFARDKLSSIHVVVPGTHHSGTWGEPESALYELRRECWGSLVERLQLRQVMSIEAWEKLDADLRRGFHEAKRANALLPEITEQAVAAFAEHHRTSIQHHWEGAVREVFDWLRPRSEARRKHKRNQVEQVGPSVVLERYIDRWRVSCGFPPIIEWDQDHRIAALERVFSGLDGKGLVQATHYSELYTQMSETKGWSGETTWFRWKAYRNGNLHLAFRRLDLVQKLNAVAGGMRIAKGRAA